MANHERGAVRPQRVNKFMPTQAQSSQELKDSHLADGVISEFIFVLSYETIWQIPRKGHMSRPVAKSRNFRTQRFKNICQSALSIKAGLEDATYNIA